MSTFSCSLPSYHGTLVASTFARSVIGLGALVLAILESQSVPLIRYPYRVSVYMLKRCRAGGAGGADDPIRGRACWMLLRTS